MILGRQTLRRWAALWSLGVALGCAGSNGKPDGGETDALTVVTEVAAQWESLINAKAAPSTAEMLALLAERPEIVEVGSEDESVWGRFADGRVLLLVDDREPGMQVRNASLPDIPPYELPTNDRVQIYDTLGTLFEPYWQDFKPWFDRAAYLTSVGVGSVEELKNVAGKGVVYISSHGTRAKLKSGQMLGVISTATPSALTFDLLYGDDLRSNALVYITVKQDLLPNGKITVASRYGITQHFVSKYMQLQPDSLVVVDACKSASPEFTQAFIGQGASLYAGWSAKVNDAIGARAVKFFFDRLLAANEYLPETPPQRSFNYVEVMSDMIARGFDHGTPASGGTTYFQIMPAGETTLGLLVPSIKHIILGFGANSRVLMLNGSFGSLEGKVRINETELSCTDWYSDVLICPVGDSGAAGVGPVVVETNGTISNARRLTEWKGTFTFTGKEGCGPGSARSLVSTMRANVRFRADVGAFREHAGADPVVEVIDFNVEPAPTVFAHASGRCTYTLPPFDPETTRWSGTKEVQWEDEHSVGVVDVPRRRIRLHLELYSRDAFNYATTCGGTLCAEGPTDVIWRTGDEGFQDGFDDFAGAVFDIPLDESWNGLAGSRTGPTPEDYQVPQASLSWTTLTVSSPPDPTAPQ